jgi:hypothetical protein
MRTSEHVAATVEPMEAAGPHVKVPDVAWGTVAGVAGGVAVAWLTARGVRGVVHLASHEMQDRLLEEGWVTRWLTRNG